ncbi:MAG: small multi-drug export protein [Candidatus Omnitrophota bacterium]
MITSALPILELRGAIPLGLKLHEPILKVCILAIIGNMAPIAPLFFLLEPISKKLRKIPFFEKFFFWLFKRTQKKGKLIEEFELLGLIIFVAIPLPMTGAWTGCMAASLLKMPFRHVFVAITIGVIIASVIVSSLCYGGTCIMNGLK